MVATSLRHNIQSAAPISFVYIDYQYVVCGFQETFVATRMHSSLIKEIGKQLSRSKFSRKCAVFTQDAYVEVCQLVWFKITRARWRSVKSCGNGKADKRVEGDIERGSYDDEKRYIYILSWIYRSVSLYGQNRSCFFRVKLGFSSWQVEYEFSFGEARGCTFLSNPLSFSRENVIYVASILVKYVCLQRCEKILLTTCERFRI